MSPAKRQEWILKYLREREEYESVDVLNSRFVIDYIQATDAKCAIQAFGAPKCPQLGRDLSTLYRLRKLRRFATGLDTGLPSMGFPRWVYSYRLLKE